MQREKNVVEKKMEDTCGEENWMQRAQLRLKAQNET